MFWQQLGWAGLIAGRYTGTVSNPDGTYAVGQDAPESSLQRGAQIRIARLDHPGVPSANLTSNSLWPNYYGNSIYIINGANWWLTGDSDVLTGASMHQYDLKFDDGKPAKGNVVVVRFQQSGWQHRCSDSDDSTAALYDVTSTSKLCMPIHRNAF